MAINETHERMLDRIPNTFDKSDGMWSYDVTKSVAVELNDHEININNILDKLDIENLFDEELERFVFPRTGITRKPATFATTDVLITGSPGSIIHVGDLVAADTIFYEITKETSIDDTGKAYVPVRCQLSGGIGNVPAQAIKDFPISLNNINTVINEKPVTNGYIAESDDSIRQRYKDKLQRPGKSGNQYHYREWSLGVVGVGKIKVYPRWAGPLTVKVVIVDSNGNLASEELVKKVFDYIESERPFGAIVTVASAIAKPIKISFNLVTLEGYEKENVKNAIKLKIENYFRSLAFESDYVSYAKIGSEILSVEGVVDYSNLQLNGTTGNIEILDEEIPQLSEVTA